ncbi:tyrosine-type recombinase/integrase [Actinoplanes sp. NPDC049265]|uniref:tyrosine-type recombinase/integrase n=1 Tax=Actinoplanes sp. NPDC049265 TaxID=3363902 RepID=UPI0037198D91
MARRNRPATADEPRKNSRGPIPKVKGLTIYQRGNKWSFTLYGEADLLTQKRERHNRGGFASDWDAFDAAMLLKAKLATGDVVKQLQPNTATVDEVMAVWLESVKPVVKATTYANWKINHDAYVSPMIGHHRMRDADVFVLNAFYKKLGSDGRRRPDNATAMYHYWKENAHQRDGQGPTSTEIAKACGVTIYAAKAALTKFRRGRVPTPQPSGLARKSIKNIHDMLSLVWVDAIGWGYAVTNATANAKLPRDPGGRRIKARQQPWTVDELARFLHIAVTDRFAALWVLVATTGMRRSELAGVDEDAIDWERKLLHVRDTRVVANGKAVDSDGKTEAGWRTISLDDFTLSELDRHVKKLEKERKDFGKDYQRTGKLFVWPKGKIPHPDTFTRIFNRLVDQAGLPPIELHDMRHVYITLARVLGVNRKILADRVGHANETVTDTIYTNKTTGHDREIAEVVGTVIRDALKQAA